jgi:hypothetical protein
MVDRTDEEVLPMSGNFGRDEDGNRIVTRFEAKMEEPSTQTDTQQTDAQTRQTDKQEVNEQDSSFDSDSEIGPHESPEGDLDMQSIGTGVTEQESQELLRNGYENLGEDEKVVRMRAAWQEFFVPSTGEEGQGQVKKNAKEVFGLEESEFDNLGLAEANEERKEIVKRWYNATQKKLQEKEGDTVTLYRGVQNEEEEASVAASWTDDPQIAKQFANEVDTGFLVKKEIPKEQILVYHEGPYCEGNQNRHDHEKEYIVLNDTPEQVDGDGVDVAPKRENAINPDELPSD